MIIDQSSSQPSVIADFTNVFAFGNPLPGVPGGFTDSSEAVEDGFASTVDSTSALPGAVNKQKPIPDPS